MIPSVLEAESRAAEERLADAARRFGLVELRADRIGADEVAGLVRRHGPGLIVTVRRRETGGGFDGSEEERRGILRAALDAGARYVDLEHDGSLVDLLREPEIARRTILSAHGVDGRREPLLALYSKLASSPAARIKIVPRAERVGPTAALRDLLAAAAADEGRLIAFAEGRGGSLSRLLAPSWGSWATYGAARRGAESAPGQLSADEMVQTYDVLRIGPRTKRYALAGSRVLGSPSPALHRAAYLARGLDARYFPVECDDLDDLAVVIDRAGPYRVEAFGVTLPHKQEAARRSVASDELAGACAAVNTVVVGEGSWRGYNTDGPAARDLLGSCIELRGSRVAILGAGGTAAAVAAALRAAGAEVTLLNRNLARARDLARRLQVDAAPVEGLDRTGWEILVNATPQGSGGERFLDPKQLTGKVVLDAVYGERGTPLARDARRSGLAVVDGMELLQAQAALQFRLMTGEVAPAGCMDAARMQWSQRRRG